jgi:hypothetical protein
MGDIRDILKYISFYCIQIFMPRKARIDAPGAVHHIIVREIERRYYARFVGILCLNLLPIAC